MKMRQLLLVAASVLIAIMMIASNVHYWWAWAVWAVVLLAQIGVAFGLDEKLKEQPQYPHLEAALQRERDAAQW